MTQPDPPYVDWLVEHSMLHTAKELATRYAGQARLWQQPYAETRPRAASALASVWFTAYPGSIITRDGESVLHTLGDDQLWRALAAIGIQGVHTGPMKLAGGLRGRDVTPTVDGNFDRISFAIDPAFGTEQEYIAMSRASRRPIGVPPMWSLASMAFPGAGSTCTISRRASRRSTGSTPRLPHNA